MRLITRLRHLIQFKIEQFILRGVVSRLMVIALAMALIALGAGLLVYGAGPDAAYDDPGAAVWWAFLRLTDSGYLGDDQSTLLRSVSTVLTVLGVVLFVGALIATMTQWLNDTIETLEAGYTPIAQNNHLLILGWNNRTARMVEQVLASEGRVARFLSRHGGRRLHIVILAERVSQAMVQELKDRLGARYDPRRITLRSGTPLRADHLKRVDFGHAAAVLLPGREFEREGAAPDEATIKTLMSAATADAETLPLMVTEILDASHLETAGRAYPGPAEFIGTALIVSRLLAQNARHPGLSWVYNEFLDGVGSQIFVRECPSLAGERLVDVAACFERAVLLGAARDGHLVPLHARDDDRVEADDRLAFIAASFEDCRPTAAVQALATPDPVARSARAARRAGHRRVLVLGWNRKVPALLAEFDAYRRETVALDVFSQLAIDVRNRELERAGAVFAHAAVRQLEGDLTAYHDMGRLAPADYDTIILVASDWLGSAEAADARVLMAYLVLSRLLESADRPPRILVETLSADNAGLFDAPHVECLISPDLQSSMLTQIALRRELHWVMEEVFGAGGAEIAFRDAQALGVAERGVGFAALQAQRAAEDEILLGVMRRAGGAPRLELNPADKQADLELAAGDELVVLAVPSAPAA
ncbi:hypothetical protein SAOR_08365 [Salinisphaera orenii MK-B5]|uniref:CASTOR/POLLUX/SYM8 ion channel conserved domain-containing protein n=1 Tax=Salinisphaera orenii MK-B5 TaxID=856730 RepID=A0A423PQN0_9GAMM|nr:hypothetical protein [Salinisphaera orenii]ROO27872.1 hypothetical protein SAOR_08365 [Salinisphaera orenii MK-B5]